MSFPSISPKQSFPALESEILAYWKANDTFKKSISSRPADNPYRFYDGPPFITGTPHYGSLLSSIVKDVVGRYWTMRGKRVDRIWGWDCHGLPIEEKVQKKLGLKSNKDIEERGVKEFIDGCYEYTQSTSAEWDWYIDKIGRWVDMDRAYRTMDQDYMESVMWVFSQLWNKGLIYEGKRVSLYSWKLSTPISNFEVAMDDTYQDVNDPAITVKFRLEPNEKFPAGTSVLAWTTTPWTIPANMALGIGEKITYVLVNLLEKGGGTSETSDGGLAVSEKSGNQSSASQAQQLLSQGVGAEHYIVAATRAETVFKGKGEYTIVREFSGAELVGLSYLPPFPEYYKNPLEKGGSRSETEAGGLAASGNQSSVTSKTGQLLSQGANKGHKIYPADFATDTDGTGIVHIAPEFGDVDFGLAKKYGIPVTEAMDEAGKYTAEIFDMEGTHYLDLENPELGANKINIERMKANNTLFKLEGITHRVPFCPRSGTPLMQRAQSSWFIDIQSQKDKLLEANKKINWFPEYLKEGRFAKGIESAPDWCISRTRFWGAPMPVWASEDGEQLVVGSREEIFELNKPFGQLTKVIFVRHGESIKNTEHIIDGTDKPRFPLTEKGRQKAREVAEVLASKKVDAIYSSPFARTQETAEIINSKLNLDITFDDRLREVYLGDMDGKKRTEIQDYYHSEHDKYVTDWNHKIGGGDSANEVLERMKSFMHEIGEKHVGETVIVVSHADQIAIIKEYLTDKKTFTNNSDLPKVGEPITIYYDVSSGKQLNLHRPYIDSIKLQSPKTSHTLTRIPEVLDVWMDSGSMPYAQMHYPFENKGEMEASFPADFIAEYVGQVRAWFYVMHVLGVLLGDLLEKGGGTRETSDGGLAVSENSENQSSVSGSGQLLSQGAGPTPAFLNVITTGVINGNDGRKMSKSFGNYPDPRVTIEKYGADPIRFYMLNSPLLSGGDMDFKEEGIIETIKSVMLPIWNTYSFFTTYANIDGWEKDGTEVWFTRHGESTSNVTNKMSDASDNPELTEKGKEQSRNAGKTLREQGKQFDIIIHTDRVRTHDTARLIGEELGFAGQYIIDEGFAEQDAGEYANKTHDEILEMAGLHPDASYIELRKVYKNNSVENLEKFKTRIIPAYEDMLKKYKGKRILIVAHAGTSRPLLASYLGMDEETANYNTTIINAEPFRLTTTKLVNPLDRWILSKLQVLTGQVHDAMEGYDVSRATRSIVEYMDEMTNWYVRLSRRRFWGSEMTADKASGYETLYTVLTELSKLLAPYMPFLSESIYKGLTDSDLLEKGGAEERGGGLAVSEKSGNQSSVSPTASQSFRGGALDNSVHLSYITLPNRHLVDTDLNRDMEIAEHIVSLGLGLRSRKNIRVRQPLQSITITRELDEYYQTIIRDELNVKEVRFENPEKLAKKICKPDARKIGPKYGKDVQYIIQQAKAGNFTEGEDGTIVIARSEPVSVVNAEAIQVSENQSMDRFVPRDDRNGYILEPGEYTMEYIPLEGIGDVEGGYGMVIAINTEITESLKLEGYARDIIRAIQDMRKEAEYQVTDRISLHIYGDTHAEILAQFEEMITTETLSTLAPLMVNPDAQKEVELDNGSTITVQIEK